MANIQFNLLPDSRLNTVNVDKRRKLVTSIAVLVSIVSVGLFVLSFFAVNVVQSKQLSDSNKEINAQLVKLKQVNDLDKVLTIQNQLKNLVTLHQSSYATSRIFGYLPQVTPTNVNIGSISVDFSAGTLTINGTATNQHAINTFVDTLKFTSYTVPGQNGQKAAFPSVIETSFSLSQGNANYSLTIHFDPALFSNSFKDSQGKLATPKLVVPSLTTTRSVINDPANTLFNGKNTGGN